MAEGIMGLMQFTSTSLIAGFISSSPSGLSVELGNQRTATSKNLLAESEVLVPVRIIVRGEDAGFGEEVTKTNNRQNRIENRDFVALDPEQSRLRSELAIDGIDYQLVRSESVTRTSNSFDLVEAITALACAS